MPQGIKQSIHAVQFGRNVETSGSVDQDSIDREFVLVRGHGLGALQALLRDRHYPVPIADANCADRAVAHERDPVTA